ncbi:MAG: hypothetical protein R2799_03175 [Crocinitomicaceae bacterium]
MKEIKCRECSTWTNADLENCTNCGVSLKIEEIEREEKRFQLFEDEKPSKFELWLERLKESENPFKLMLYSILKTFYVVYMAIIGFVVWSTLWFSG